MQTAINAGISDLYQAWAEHGGQNDFIPTLFQTDAAYLVAYEILLTPELHAELTKADKENLESTEILAITKIPSAFAKVGHTLQLHPIWWNTESIFGTATVGYLGLQSLKELVMLGHLKRYEVSLMPRQARPRHPHGLPHLGVGDRVPEQQSEGEVLFGLIDHGCPFAHPGLKAKSGGSRLLNVWYQDEKNAKLLTAARPKPWGFGYAAKATDFDNFLAANNGMEDWRIYANAGMPELKRNASHGAHMLGDLLDAQRSPSIMWALAAHGIAPEIKELELPPSADLVFVQLPDVYLDNMTRCAIAPYRLAALRYILASAGSKTKRVIVPISSEDFVGSHDGTTLFESAMDAMVDFAKKVKHKQLQILIAAGNNLRMRTHSKGTVVRKDEAASFKLRVHPANELPTFVEIWLDKEVDELQVSLTANASSNIPNPILTSADIDINFVEAISDVDGKMQAGIVNMKLQGQQVLLVRLPPSFTYDPSIATLPASDWEISIKGEKKNFTAHAYIARSYAGLGGVKRSTQSQFLLPRRETKDSDTLAQAYDLSDEFPEYGAGSVSGMANGKNVAVVGAYRLWDQRRSSYSAAGPSRAGGRLVASKYPVDYAAPADQSPSLAGIRNWSNRNGGSIRLNGASVSTPLAARWVAKHPPATFPPAPPTIVNGKHDPRIEPKVIQIIGI